MGIDFKIGVAIDSKMLTGQAGRNYSKMLTASYKEAGLFVEGEVAKKTPVNTGRLRKSISSRVRGTGFRQYGQVFSPLEYSRYIEEGQLPHLPPEKPIMLWVSRKLSAVKAKLKAMLVGTPGVTIKMPAQKMKRKAVWAIRSKIAKVGTKGVHMFKKVFDAPLTGKTVRDIFFRNTTRFIQKLNL